MEYNTLAYQFVEEFKEFEPILHEQIKYDGELLNHVFFGECNDYFMILIEKEKETDEIQRLFYFFEKMATKGDKDVKDLLAVTILARLADSNKCLQIAHKYMGPETRKASDEMERFLRRG